MKNILIPKTNLSKISVFLIWIFHTCGLIGILYVYRELFLQTTPFNLSMTFILLFFNLEEVNKKVIIALTTAFVVGMIAETIGVNPYYLLVGATVAASCAFMLPVATPPTLY